MATQQAQLEDLVQGLHHITLVTSNEEVNRRFYTEILGLRRVKLTVNQDDIFHRHLFYADETGRTGSAITFFEWPDLLQGVTGLTSPHHLAYNVTSLDALPKWRAWLLSKSVSVVGPIVRDDRVSLYLRDPDGVMVEITKPNHEAVKGEYIEELVREAPVADGISSEMKLSFFNHASPVTSNPDVTTRFFKKTLGLSSSSVKPNPDQADVSILAIGNDDQPDFLRYLASPNAPLGEVGAGSVHHIAMCVNDDNDQLRVMKQLNSLGISNSGVVDRFWFKSLYFHDPHGNLLEVATKGPGYTADESLEKLGSNLVLAPWLEPRRNEIQRSLNQLDQTNARSWPPSYSPVSSRPENLAN